MREARLLTRASLTSQIWVTHVSKSLTPILPKLCRFLYSIYDDLSMKKLIFSHLKNARVTLVKSSIVCLSSGENNQAKPVPFKMHNIKRY